MRKNQLLMVFKEMHPMLYFLGALFITKDILRNIWGNAGLVQKVSSYFGRDIRQTGKYDKVLWTYRLFFRWWLWWEIKNFKTSMGCTGISCIWKANISWMVYHRKGRFIFSMFFYFVICCRKQKSKRFFKLREHDTRVLNLGRTYFAVFRKLKPYSLVLNNRGP